MGVFNKKNAMIGWAVMEAVKIANGRRAKADEAAAEEKKSHWAGKTLAVATGAVVAVGGLAALRRRKSGPSAEE